MANNTPNIPSLSSKVDVEVKRAIEDIKIWFTQISSSGGVVTQAGLASGLADIPALTPFLDGTIPPQLANFTSTGAFRTIMLTWDEPRYSSFSFVEVWRATVNDLGVAVRIGTTQSTLYADLPPNASLSVTYYYWARVISKAGIVGPFNATAGTPARTADDPAYMLEVLTNRLSATQLAVSLSSRIDLIDTPGGLVDSLDDLSVSILNSIPDTATWLNQLIREKAISDATVDINATTGVISLKALTANILPDDLVRINSLEFNLNAANGSILGHTNTLSAQADTLTSQDTRITQAEGNIGLKASTAYVDGKTQEVANLLGPDAAAMFGDDVPSALFWLLFAAKDAKDEARVNTASMAIAQFDLKSNADAILAEAEARLLLVAAVADSAAAIDQINTVSASSGSALARSVATTQTTVEGHTASVQTLQSSMDGINAQYTIKLDVGGKVAGVGLMNDGAASAMIVNVDKFAIAGTGATDAYPFIVVGGVTYIKAALITDITSVNIRAAGIAADRLSVVSLSAISANLGAVTAGTIDGVVITGSTLRTAASGARFVVDAASKAARFYDVAGTEKVWIGTANSSGYNTYAVYGVRSGTIAGAMGLSGSSAGLVGLATSGNGLVGGATSGLGVVGNSNTGYGGWFGDASADLNGNRTSDGSKGPIKLMQSSSLAAPVHSAVGGTLWVTAVGILYINTTAYNYGEGTGWQKVGSQ